MSLTNMAGTWVWHSLTERGPGSDTHWQGGDLGLTLTDRAGIWVWHSLTERGSESDTHWLGGDLGVTLTDRAGTWVWHSLTKRDLVLTLTDWAGTWGWHSLTGRGPGSDTHWRGGNPVPAMSVRVRPRSPPCLWPAPMAHSFRLGLVTWRYQVRIPVEPDICHRGCAYTVLQTFQRHGMHSAAYGTVH